MSPTQVSHGFDGALGSISLRDILTIVFKRRRLIVSVAGSIFVLVAAYSLLQPRTYEVSATLLVNSSRAEIPLAPTESPQVIVNRLSEQDLNSEIEVLKSRQLIEEVVHDLGVNDQPETNAIIRTVRSLSRRIKIALGKQQMSAVDWQVEKIGKTIEISAVRRSNVIKISYRSQDPLRAKQVVETLIEKFLARRAEMYRSPQAVSFFQEQMVNAERRLKEAEALLEKFAGESSITVVDGPNASDSASAQKSIVMGRLADLESSLGDAEVEFDAQLRQVSSLRLNLQGEPERLASSNRQNQDAAEEEIVRALAALRLQRDSLLQDFRSDSRYVRDIDTQIEMAEKQLERARDEANVSGTETNPVFQDLKGELLRAEAGLEGTRARVLSLKAQVANYQGVLDSLNEQAFTLDELLREAKAAEEDYLLYRKKHEEARISAAMDQQMMINVAVAQPAQLPPRSESRGLAIKLPLGLLIGLLVGFGTAFVIEQFLDHTFTTGEDVDRLLGIPLLASIPDNARMR